MLEVTNLNVSIAQMRILADVSLLVNKGEIVAVIGSNGAGKTSLLRAISGLNPITSGEIRFEGKSITGLRPDQIVRLGISQIPERGRIFPHMTVYEHLQLGSWIQKNSKQIREDVDAVFRFFPVLEQRKKQMAGTLSGGERQMMAIARALMSRPRLLLLDEPTLGLSPLMSLQLGKIVQGLNKTGTSILLVEQNASLALAISHRAYVLETGKIVLEGRSVELAKNDGVKKAYLGID